MAIKVFAVYEIGVFSRRNEHCAIRDAKQLIDKDKLPDFKDVKFHTEFVPDKKSHHFDVNLLDDTRYVLHANF